MNFLLFISCLMLTGTVYSANILAICPFPGYSHFRSTQPLLKELIKRGHNLTLISPFPLDKHLAANYRLVNITSLFSDWNNTDIAEKVRAGRSIRYVTTLFELNHNLSERILKFSEIQNLIQSNEHYDLVISELFFMDVFFVFGNKFNAPVIAFKTLKMLPFYNYILRNPFPSSYDPNYIFRLTEKMSLISRIHNTVYNIFSVLYYEFVILPTSQKLITSYFHFDKNSEPQLRDIMKNISVTMVNQHYSFGYQKPNLPNVVDVAGIHLVPPKPLSLDLQKFMDTADHGVIFMSFGSMIGPNNFPHLGDILTRIFNKLSQKVMMKWDPKLLSNIPENVLVQEWFPQSSILNHPNTKLFITHGGLHSSLESLNASVPVIGVPYFADQEYNIAIMEYYEMGILVTVEELATSLPTKIDEILNNPKYLINMQKRSQLFRDRLIKPMDEAMYWVDHLIKYKNTDHLKSAALELTWYQLYSVDVIVLFLVFITSVIYLIMLIVQWLAKKLYTMKNKIFEHRVKPYQRSKILNVKSD